MQAGLEDSKAALLVVIGACTNGQQVVLAVESGQRESQESWGAVLWDLRAWGLQPQRCPQFRVFSQTHFSFTKGRVCIAHEA